MDKYMNEKEMQEELNKLKKRVSELRDKEEMPTANVMVAGITGVGKSTLINAIFGKNVAETGAGKPVTDKIKEHTDSNMPICIWDTVGLELDPVKAENSIREIKNAIAKKENNSDAFDRIHAIWYCINSQGKRYQGKELEFIKELHELGIPFIIVLTQCVEMPAVTDEFENQIHEINKDMGLYDIDIVQVCAEEYPSRGGMIPVEGLEELINTTTERMPEFITKGFIAAQKVNKEKKRDESKKIIDKYVNKSKEAVWDKVAIVKGFVANSKIFEMLSEIGGMYVGLLSNDVLVELFNSNSKLNLENIWDGLIISPEKRYKPKLKTLLKEERNSKYEINIDEFNNTTDRVAIMLMFYGFTFIDAIEGVWDKATEEELNNKKYMVENLAKELNERLKKG